MRTPCRTYRHNPSIVDIAEMMVVPEIRHEHGVVSHDCITYFIEITVFIIPYIQCPFQGVRFCPCQPLLLIYHSHAEFCHLVCKPGRVRTVHHPSFKDGFGRNHGKPHVLEFFPELGICLSMFPSPVSPFSRKRADYPRHGNLVYVRETEPHVPVGRVDARTFKKSGNPTDLKLQYFHHHPPFSSKRHSPQEAAPM